MLLSGGILFFAVVCCAFAEGQDGYYPSRRQAMDSVLRKVVAESAGDDDTTINVDGNVEWKETIKVNKKQEGTEDYTFEMCCTVPSNQSFNGTVRDCILDVSERFRAQGAVDRMEKTRRRMKAVNCFLQCLTYRLGLSETDGSINPEEMVSFILNDSRTMTLGISESMIYRCIDIARGKGSGLTDIITEMVQTYEEADICYSPSVEILKFVKCMTALETLYCPAAYLRQSKYCDRTRQMMKRETAMSYRPEKRRYRY